MCRSKRSQGKSSQEQQEAAASDNIDNCALFIGNKNIWYPGVLIEKKAKNTKNDIKKLPAQDCISKEAKTIKISKSQTSKELPARDCNKDGDLNHLKERKDPLPAYNNYVKTLASRT